MISEWKGYPHRVRAATDTGKPWLLANALNVPNPIEQVARQLDAVRTVLRGSILPQYFPSAEQHGVLITQSVYSPQVDKNTAKREMILRRLRIIGHSNRKTEAPEGSRYFAQTRLSLAVMG